jgi:hypothetical protein
MKANGKMIWFSEILDDGSDSPVFLVMASGDMTTSFRRATPTAQ